MSKEIRIQFKPDEVDVYACIFKNDVGVYKVNIAGSDTWEVFDDTRIGLYDIPTPESGEGSGIYVANFPVTITTPGRYDIAAFQGDKIYDSSGSTQISLGGRSINWSGTAEIFSNTTVPDVAGTAASLHSITNGKVDAAPGLNWDEILTGDSHNIPGSAGRRLRTTASAVIRNEDLPAQTGINNSNQIKFDLGASAVDGAYDPAKVCIISGDGIGQSRLILQYNGSSKVATVDRNWKVNPVEDDEFIIHTDAGREHVNEGLARAGDTSTITLNALASASDNTYRNQRVFIRSGTGEDQIRRIISYDGTSKIATVAHSWDTVPDNTSGYVMLPATCVEMQAIKGQELDTNVGTNFNKFYENDEEVTSVVLDDIGEIKDAVDGLTPGSPVNIEHRSESIVRQAATAETTEGTVARESDPKVGSTQVDRESTPETNEGSVDTGLIIPTAPVDRESSPEVQGDT